MTARYGIAEWYGQPFLGLAGEERRQLAQVALGEGEPGLCPFQNGRPRCRKAGGVCSLHRYGEAADGRSGSPVGDPVIVCPERFKERSLLVRWLAEIVGFNPQEATMAREVPFTRGTGTNKPAGKIDLVIASEVDGRLRWYGLEIQAVYFSGTGMSSQFEALRDDAVLPEFGVDLRSSPLPARPPFPDAVRRPDWRSSSAKRLMPQLQIKAPTLRRWGSKIAVGVDRPFFDSIGGPSPGHSRDLNDGDVVWLVPELARDANGRYRFSRGHWEVLTLEDSEKKLLAAEGVRREAFERDLRNRLEPIA